MEGGKNKILYDEQGLKPGTSYEKGQWKEIATHSETEIKGFFGEYRFLSNFWPAKVFLDGEEYGSTENAYQAAKYKKEFRGYLRTCSPKEAVAFVRENDHEKLADEDWVAKRIEVMRGLLLQKFDKELNPDNFDKLVQTGGKYLEETNYWGDTFWGVNKSSANEDGVGENNLGKLLMAVRDVFVIKTA